MNRAVLMTISEISHLVAQASISDDDTVRIEKLREIAREALAVLRPKDLAKVIGDDRGESAAEIASTIGMIDRPEEKKPELTGMAKFLTVKEGVTLHRFNGKEEIRLIGRRKGVSGSPNSIFEICVGKQSKIARCFRDGEELFEICCCEAGRKHAESMAVSALHRYLKKQRPAHSVRRRLRREKEAAK